MQLLTALPKSNPDSYSRLDLLLAIEDYMDSVQDTFQGSLPK
jgi:hypothetical protein